MAIPRGKVIEKMRIEREQASVEAPVAPDPVAVQ
jgi:hypothetical protein